jgi:hypothetical protein
MPVISTEYGSSARASAIIIATANSAKSQSTAARE